MFNKLKHLKNLRNKAKAIQNTLALESTTVAKGGVNITMNGNMEITAITINPDLAIASLEGILKDIINDTIKKTQKLMAQKRQEMGGLPNF